MSEHRLNEIVIERPRGGRRISAKKLAGFKKQLSELTVEASQDGLLRPYLIKPRNKSKYLSDHLGPLRRFLRSQVGQPWNDVHSKLCQRLDANTMTGRHVLDHVYDYVEQHVELIDGIPYEKSRQEFQLSRSYHIKLFVHPETGILLDAKEVTQALLKPSSPEPKSLPEIIDLDAYHQYRKIDDIWYLITYQEFPASGIVFDVLQRVMVPSEQRGYRDRRYAAHKRQCGKREIKIIQEKLNQMT